MDKFEEIKNFKELLDNGIITQEEFDKKKKELLEGKDPSGTNLINGIIGGAKEKSEQAKAVAAEKLEELKKKQAEDAEKRKKEEEERKQKEAELQAQKAEQNRLAEEQKKKAAEEKKAKEEEKRKNREEKKEQAKQKRKDFFAKKSVKISIGVICALIIAFIAFCVYVYVTRDTIKDDFSETKTYTLHDLEYLVPANWEEDTDNVTTADSAALESKGFVRRDKKSGDVLGGIVYQYFGDDQDIDSLINEHVGSDGWEEYALTDAPDYVKAYKKEGKESYEFVTFANPDYSTFITYALVLISAYDENTINSILSAPKYASYKNKAQVEDITVNYTGSSEDGYTASKKDFEVLIKYAGKDAVKTEVFEITPSAPVINRGQTTAVKVKCHGLEKDIELKGKQVEKVTAEYIGSKEEGTVIGQGNKDLVVTVKWDDGSEEVVTDYTMDKEIKLEAGGTGEATITAFGATTKLKVECSTLTEAQFKEKCKTRGYKDLLRKASYAEYTKIYGKVVQDCGKGYYRITSGGSAWDNVYMVTVLSNDTLVEDDWVTCYGVTTGIYTYETVMGASQKVPWLTAKYVEID